MKINLGHFFECGIVQLDDWFRVAYWQGDPTGFVCRGFSDLVVEHNNRVVLTHEVGVELILLLRDQPLLDVYQTNVDLLEIKCKQNKTPHEEPFFYFMEHIKLRQLLLDLQWEAVDKILVVFLPLEIQNNLRSLINRKNAEKDNSKVTLAQDEGANDVGYVQGVNKILVLLDAWNHLFCSFIRSSESKINGKHKKEQNGYESDCSPEPPSEQGKYWAQDSNVY